MVGAVILGLLGGLMGGLFIRVNNWFNMQRKRFLKTKTTKILEGLLLTTLTVSVMFCIVGFSYEAAGKDYEVIQTQSYNETSKQWYLTWT